MKPRQTVPKKLAIAILTIMGICVLCMFFQGCTSTQSAVNYHQGLQKELTYGNAVNNLETFTTKSAKEDRKELKKEIRSEEKNNSENAKRKSIEEENAELRKKLEEIKKP